MTKSKSLIQYHIVTTDDGCYIDEGPWDTREDAQRFIDCEVGIPARVVVRYDVDPIVDGLPQEGDDLNGAVLNLASGNEAVLSDVLQRFVDIFAPMMRGAGGCNADTDDALHRILFELSKHPEVVSTDAMQTGGGVMVFGAMTSCGHLITFNDECIIVYPLVDADSIALSADSDAADSDVERTFYYFCEADPDSDNADYCGLEYGCQSGDHAWRSVKSEFPQADPSEYQCCECFETVDVRPVIRWAVPVVETVTRRGVAVITAATEEEARELADAMNDVELWDACRLSGGTVPEDDCCGAGLSPDSDADVDEVM